MAVKRKPVPTRPPQNDDETDSSSSSESESEQDEEVKLTEPSKTAAYKTEAILDKLADIRWPENIDWTHTLSVDVSLGESKVDANDDLARELSFYNQALEGSRAAMERLEGRGLPFLRPADYYAEMAKSDAHMEKVKSRLLSEKRKVEEAEERRKARESKRVSKEVQSQKKKERAKQKKEDIESVKKWRKQRQKSGFAKDEDGAGDLAFEEAKPFERKKGGPRPPMSRKKRDSKYGFGGRKGLKKQNRAESEAEVFRSFGKINGRGGGHANKKRKV